MLYLMLLCQKLMTTYRQDLRNLPATLAADATADDVEAVTFPTKPE